MRGARGVLEGKKGPFLLDPGEDRVFAKTAIFDLF